MNIIKILVVEPNKEPYVKEIKNNIGEIYGIVYFPFEITKIDKNIALISSFGAKQINSNEFKANRIYKDKIIYSNFVIIGIKDNAYISLKDEQICKYMNLFQLKENLKLKNT